MYHINLQGEPGVCKATQVCPFGDFETQHYTTAEQARAAYEGAMEGKTISSFQKREAHFEALTDEQKEAERAKRARRKYLESLKRPTTPLPLMPEPGHWAEPGRHGNLMAGDELPDGRIVTSVRHGWNRKMTVYYRTEAEPNKKPRDRFEVNEDEPLEGKVWRSTVAPDALAAYDAQLQEHVLEDSTLNFSTPKRSARLVGGFAEQYHATGYLKYRRYFKSKLKDFQKAGISLPHSRAFEAAYHAFQDEWGNREAGHELFRGIMKQECLSSYYDRSLEILFPEGERMFVDFWPDRVRKERQEAGLL